MAKKITSEIKDEGMSIANIALGLGGTLLGGVILGAPGAAAGTWAGAKYLAKGQKNKDSVKLLGYGSTIDMAFETLFGGEGYID